MGELKTKTSNDELSIKEIIQFFQEWWNYLLKRWVSILIFGLVGGGLGIVYSLITVPKYTASFSFALIESDNQMSGLANLASSFGFSGLLGSGGSAFSGDNLLEIMKSRYAIEQTLLRPVNYKNENKTLADVYIEITNIRKKWKQSEKVSELKTLSYPIGKTRETFTRVQDSVLNVFYKAVSGPKSLSIVRKDRKLSIVNINFTSFNETFSKLFVENLMDETYKFYSHTRTSQSRANVDMMQQTADSIKALYEAALYKGAGYSQVNINQALSFAAVPRIKQETNAQLYGTVYTEVLKNLETLKLDLARKTPLVQIIDTPRYPLEKKRFGKLKGLIFGGFLGGFFCVVYLLLKMQLTNFTVNKN